MSVRAHWQRRQKPRGSAKQQIVIALQKTGNSNIRSAVTHLFGVLWYKESYIKRLANMSMLCAACTGLRDHKHCSNQAEWLSLLRQVRQFKNAVTRFLFLIIYSDEPITYCLSECCLSPVFLSSNPCMEISLFSFPFYEQLFMVVCHSFCQMFAIDALFNGFLPKQTRQIHLECFFFVFFCVVFVCWITMTFLQRLLCDSISLLHRG